jgi:hypothetical protein
MIRPPYLWLSPVVLLALALLRMPYGYYTFLRVALCCAGVILAYQLYRRAGALTGWVVAFGLIAVLYNPFVVVHLDRPIWSVINLVTIAVFVAGYVKIGHGEGGQANTSSPES